MTNLLRTGVATVVAVVVAVGLAAGCTVGTGKATDKTADWDPRVLEIARQVEDLRGLDFERPVAVRWLSPAKFAKTMQTDAEDLTKADRRDLARQTAALQSIGMIGPDVDLLAVGNDTTGTLGYYREGTDRITMPKGRITPEAEVTLAHELTHALQDQNFGLEAVDRRGSRASLATDAVVEGDAERTADRYRDRMPRKERKRSYGDASADEIDPAAATVDVPDAFALQEMVPYELGPMMVEQAKTARPAGVNSLFLHPPRSEAAFLTPWTLIQGIGLRTVAVPDLAAGETRVGHPQKLDAYGLYLLLASRLGADRALAAADQYGGDRWVTFERGDTTCSRITVRARSRAGAPTLQRAVSDWAAAMPAGVASATTAGRSTTLTSCDDGSSAGPMPGGAESVAALAWERNGTYRYLVTVQPVSVSRCASDRMARDPASVAFSYVRETKATRAEIDAFFRRLDQVVEECGGVTG